MRKKCLPFIFTCLLLSSTTIHSFAIAKNDTTKVAQKSELLFELKNGDRVVLLGNSLVENDLHYGYIEFALTSRWPENDVTFRNLGWSGDTVFGDARSYFTSPPSAYDLLIKQLINAQPTVVFLAYGANEAYKGEAGVSDFVQGLNQLLDKIDSLGAQTVLLSPIPQMPVGSPTVDVSARNENLKLYADAISKVASERDKQFVDLFTPFQKIDKNLPLTTDGVHLNKTGYYHLAAMVEDGLGLSPRKWSVKVDLSKQKVEAAGTPKILVADIGNGEVNFTMNESLLPLPLPDHEGKAGNYAPELKIVGLTKGCYTLTVDGTQVASATAKQWAEGVAINQGTTFSRADQLQDQILKKNELFFRQYRPLNRTYITGFRAYEQGRHAEELEQLNLIIKWMEGQIAGTRTPKSNMYQLALIK